MKDEIVLNLLKRDFDSLEDDDTLDSQFVNCKDCPVGRAFRRQFPDKDYFVSLRHIIIYPFKRYYPVGAEIKQRAIIKAAEKLKTQSKVVIRFKAR